uniref:Chorismate mutase isoform IRII n=1 Tax=Globodera rostochiensis TaxID=31243 RepID=B6C764_GLORO|nr:chorismate mutase isoform IRII [Globodera rostochiensis]
MNLLVVPFFLSLFLPFAPAAKSPARRAVANRQNGHINCEKHCTDHYLTENNKCKSSEEVILRKSDCAFMKSIEDGFKFVVGMEGQTETESTTGNNIFMCCKPNQGTVTKWKEKSFRFDHFLPVCNHFDQRRPLSSLSAWPTNG